MSAGGISYSMITNHGKITLPSVDAGLGSMNILRDPPKSLYTRRIDKVGETSSITEMIDESGDRACEAIQVYARGVNPFVSVSYSNDSTAQRGSSITTDRVQAKLPYSVMRDGAFRPPVLLQEDLLPLSRMPRNWTSAFSQPGFADYSRKLRTCGTAEETREVKNKTLKAHVRPTAVYQIEKPISEPFEVKYVIQPKLKVSATSGIRTMDVTQRHGTTPIKEIDIEPMHAHARTNIARSDIYVDNSEFDLSRYIHDTNPHAVTTNISSNLHHTPIDELLDLSDLPVRNDVRHSSAYAHVSGVEQMRYDHEDIHLERTIPSYQASTNYADTRIHKRIDHENVLQLDRNMPMGSFTSNPVARGSDDPMSRDVHLRPRINPGGYAVPASVPLADRMQNGYSSQESEKSRMNRLVAESMQGRFDKPSPYGAPMHMTTPVY